MTSIPYLGMPVPGLPGMMPMQAPGFQPATSTTPGYTPPHFSRPPAPVMQGQNSFNPRTNSPMPQRPPPFGIHPSNGPGPNNPPPAFRHGMPPQRY